MSEPTPAPAESDAQGFLQVVTTLPSEQEAVQLAHAVVARRLAACVQIVGPLTSVYRWQGAVETSQEWQCLLKTTVACYAELASAINELHPYEVPELIATPIVCGSQAYLAWIKQEVAPS